ncbi:hypothetical protein PI125_g9621 [Phytophthora idaei]|nr:hypothetical protein PI125_g9621 [Phytophthora idaei]
MSDTTPSARKVSKLFEGSRPTNCSMHVLNLCLMHGMGMRENYETVHVLGPETNEQKKVQRLCTVGGAFPKAYVQHCESYDDSAVFDKLVYAVWRLLIEMESIMQSLADLALIDAQRSNQVSSELIVLMKFTIDRLATDTYQIYELDGARSPKMNEHSLPRHDAHINTLSPRLKSA